MNSHMDIYLLVVIRFGHKSSQKKLCQGLWIIFRSKTCIIDMKKSPKLKGNFTKNTINKTFIRI